MSLSPICIVQDNGGPFNPTTMGINVSPGDTVGIQLNSSTGVTSWYLQIYGTDELANTGVITLSNVNPVTNQVASTTDTVSFTFPASLGAPGNTLIFLSTVNGAGGPLSTTFGIFTLTTSGNRVGALGQTREADPVFGWAPIVNPAIRSVGSAASDLNISGQTEGDLLYYNGSHWSRVPAGTVGYFLQTDSTSGAPIWTALPLPTDLNISGESQGDLLYFNGSHWVRLAAGTSGNFLQTQGSSANPIWASVISGVSSVGASSPIASSGGTTPNITFFIFGQTEGDLVYYNGTNWTRLPAGTSGQYLETQGASASPQWITPTIYVSSVGASSPIASSGGLTPTISFSIAGQTEGDLVYYNGTNWTRLPAGTSGQFLTTEGSSAIPQWTTGYYNGHRLWLSRPILAGIASTANTSTLPLVVGAVLFKPSDETTGRSVWFRVILSTTNASYQANIELLDVNNVLGNGVGAAVPSSLLQTTSITPTELEVELTSLESSLSSNILLTAVIYLTTSSAGQAVTAYNAALYVQE